METYFSSLFAADCCYRAKEIANVECLLFKPPISTEKKKGPLNTQQDFIVTYCDIVIIFGNYCVDIKTKEKLHRAAMI